MSTTLPRLFQESQITQRTTDGYINATKLCQAAGKKLSDYKRQEVSKAYLEALSIDAGIPASKLLEVRKGGVKELQGTWAHPQVAIHLAMWCSPTFSVVVTKWVVEWMTAQAIPKVTSQAQAPTTEKLKHMCIRLNEAMSYWESAFNKVAELNSSACDHLSGIEEELELLESCLSAYIDQCRYRQLFKQSDKAQLSQIEAELNRLWVIDDRRRALKKTVDNIIEMIAADHSQVYKQAPSSGTARD